MTTDVVEVHVGTDGNHWLARDPGQQRRQWHEPGAAIHQQVAVATANVPDVAAGKRVHVRLPDQGDPAPK
jgi:hypothetical protein